MSRVIRTSNGTISEARQTLTPAPTPMSGTIHPEMGEGFPDGFCSPLSALQNPLAEHRVRPFAETDREAADALGTPTVYWWHREADGASLHLVAESTKTGEIVGRLQARDRSVPEPSRRPGQCHFMLSVAPEHRRKGIGGSLYDLLEAFACGRKAVLLYGGYTETSDAPAASFLRSRDFTVLERFLPSFLDLDTFDPSEFSSEVERVVRQGIVLTTYAELGDTPEHRRRLHDLEERAHVIQPFREVEPYVPTPYDRWEEEFLQRDLTAIFLALFDGAFVGVVTSLEWNFTGTHPDWGGRGIATALKVRALQLAKARGLARVETENQEDNGAMLAINRKLGFVFTDPEVACVKRLG